MNNSNQNQRPDNNLVWAILSTLFCCLPLGIVSIIYAAKVDGLYRNGDYEDACEAAENSRKYAKWAAVSGIILFVITIIIEVFVIGIAAISSDDDSSSTNTELVLEDKDDIAELRKAIEAEISSANADLPEEINDVMTITSMQVKGNYIICRVECDEDEISIANLNSNKAEMKKEVRENLPKEYGSELNDIKKANFGYIWEYVGDQSGEICSIKIEASEL